MQLRNLTFLGANNAVMAGATVTICLTGTPTLASLFKDSMGATPINNPFQLDAFGRAQVAIADGLYDISATAGQITLSYQSEQWLDPAQAISTVQSSKQAALQAQAAALVSENNAQAYAARAGLYKAYATKAAASADVANIPANAWVRVQADESLSQSPRTEYQYVGGVLSNQTVLGPTLPQLGQSGESFANFMEVLPDAVMVPNQTLINALAAGSVNITLVGTSIDEGADIHYPNHWFSALNEMLQTQIPSINWNLLNLGLISRNISQLASSTYVGNTTDTTSSGFYRTATPQGFTLASFPDVWQRDLCWPAGSVVGKSWRDHVRDSLPDVVFIHHGMNEGGDEADFYTNLMSFVAYTQTWTKAPYIVLVAEYLPVATPGQWWGNDANQNGTQAVADLVRYLAMSKGWGLIDPNSFYRMLRDGVRTEFGRFVHEANFRYFGDTTKWYTSDGSIAYNSGTKALTIDSGNQFAVRLAKARDVDLSAIWGHRTPRAKPRRFSPGITRA